MMNRKPVPDVIANSFWVTLMLLRVFLTNSPIFSVVYFMAFKMLPCGNIIALMDGIKQIIPEREQNTAY
jgi:hypothetical protein